MSAGSGERVSLDPSAHSVAQTFLRSQEALVGSRITRYGQDVLSNLGSSIEDPDQIILVPVLITEETPERVTHTLDMLRQAQEAALTSDGPGGKGWTVISANMPKDDGGPNARRVMSAIRAYQREHPGFNLSFFEAKYDDGYPIGSIMDDLTSASIAAYTSHAGEAARNIPLVRCDVDADKIPNNYLISLHKEANSAPASNWLLHPHVRHSRLDSDRPPEENRFKRINNLLNWYDLEDFLRDFIPDSHYAVDLIGYCQAGGMRDVASREVAMLMGGAQRHGSPFYTATIKSTIHNSPRRLVWRGLWDGAFEYDDVLVGQRTGHRMPEPQRDLDHATYSWMLGSRILETSSAYRYRPVPLTNMLDRPPVNRQFDPARAKAFITMASAMMMYAIPETPDER